MDFGFLVGQYLNLFYNSKICTYGKNGKIQLNNQD